MGVKVLLTGSSGYLGRLLISHFKNMEEIECITGVDNSPMPQDQASSKVKIIIIKDNFRIKNNNVMNDEIKLCDIKNFNLSKLTILIKIN